MFSTTDICNIAIQIEKNGEETYLKASKVTKDPQIAEILTWMAKEEAHHAKWFEKLSTEITVTEEEQKINEMGRDLLQNMVKGNSFLMQQDELEKCETIESVIDRSIEFEQDTILFFEFLLDLLDEEQTAQQLKKIIAEEHNHIDKLKLLRQGKFSSHEPLVVD